MTHEYFQGHRFIDCQFTCPNTCDITSSQKTNLFAIVSSSSSSFDRRCNTSCTASLCPWVSFVAECVINMQGYVGSSEELAKQLLLVCQFPHWHDTQIFMAATQMPGEWFQQTLYSQTVCYYFYLHTHNHC
jgi:hypothetical protein